MAGEVRPKSVGELATSRNKMVGMVQGPTLKAYLYFIECHILWRELLVA